MAPYPELLWIFEGLFINPNDAPDGYQDSWFSFIDLSASRMLPAIPPQYRREFEENRVVYVVGLPIHWSPPDTMGMFSAIGNVEKCIVVVDMVSRESFRWVVMATTGERDEAIRIFHNVSIGDEFYQGKNRGMRIRLCPAAGPGEHILFPTQLFRDAHHQIVQSTQDASTSSPESQTCHAHPLPPSPASTSSKEAPEDEVIRETLRTFSFHDKAVDLNEEEDHKDKGKQPQSTSPTTPTIITTPPEGFITQAVSWANIAGIANPSSRNIDIQPTAKPTTARLKPVGRIPSISSNNESHTDQIRVVHLLNIPPNLTLQGVSDAVQEGPLRCIQFATDEEAGTRYAGIVFQTARDAEQFYQVLVRERTESRPNRFKFIVDAARGDPFPMDATLRAMGAPNFASRRLTIVKSRFFFMFGERQLKALCDKLVGADKIQLVWLYNGGNATVVFSDVNAAIIVKNKLDDMSEGIGLISGQSASTWEGLQTTFSKDPCVQPLELKTAMTTA
ncbi:hypothetical protein BJ875DRAFT_42246 [Amylocarpus encephaloides]|uniref:RRM domain-containing protein n=1 Tax=Amylocarpus encephaloides TaxID=45428 RepID=A0A9P8C4E5_9HELO|nr:hypothetical protein BJ875DRAFT_42246 [Amylocarpus encephaloides]